MKKRRLGKFRVTRDLIHQYPDELCELFGQCVVLDAKCLMSFDAVEYVAYCKDFEVIEPTAEPRYYLVAFDQSHVKNDAGKMVKSVGNFRFER